MVVSVGSVHGLLALDGIGLEKLHLPVAGERYLLTGRHYPHHTVHNDFEVRANQGPGFSVLISSSEPVSLILCPASPNDLELSVGREEENCKAAVDG